MLLMKLQVHIKAADNVHKINSWTDTSSDVSPGQKLCHVLFTHPTKDLKLLQVADVSLLILPKGDALNNCRPFQFQD